MTGAPEALDDAEFWSLLATSEVGTPALVAAYLRCKEQPDFVENCLRLVGQPSLSAQAQGAYLLRKWCSERPLTAEQGTTLAATLPGLQALQAQLYLCQIVASHLEAAQLPPQPTMAFLRTARQHPMPETRGWAVAATVALGQRHPAFRLEAYGACQLARKDPAKVVRERVAKVMEKSYLGA